MTRRYREVLEHYGLRGSKNTPGRAHENGDVESSHRGFKNALDQRLRLRGSRDFESVESYWQFVEALVNKVVETLSRIYNAAEDKGLIPEGSNPCGLVVKNRERKRAVHAKALAMGGVDEGSPGPRGTGDFYGGYFRDPDGNKLVAYCWQEVR